VAHPDAATALRIGGRGARRRATCTAGGAAHLAVARGPRSSRAPGAAVGQPLAVSLRNDLVTA